MKTIQGPPFNPGGPEFQAQHSDEYFKLLFERYAEGVDRCLQTELFGELMSRYSAVSLALEKTINRLSSIDTMRRRAEEIAMLGNWLLDPQTQRLEWSETMYKITGVDENRMPDIGAFMENVYREDLPAVRAAAQKLLAGGEPGDLLYRMQMRDGAVKWVHAQHVVTRGDDGNVINIHGTLQDVTAAKQAELKLKQYSDHLEELVREKSNELFAAQMATIQALVKLAESRDDETGDHIERMAKYCHALTVALQAGGPYASQIDDAFVRNIALASPLHDIGKVGIPDHILLKPGKLTPEEFAVMKTHVIIGYETLASVNASYPGNGYLQMGMDIAQFHHEKWDGSGYMDGLKGEDIPLSARILALCDVYDALRSRRVYKEPFSHEKSREIILNGKGRHFGPMLVEAFDEHHTAFGEIFNQSVSL